MKVTTIEEVNDISRTFQLMIDDTFQLMIDDTFQLMIDEIPDKKKKVLLTDNIL